MSQPTNNMVDEAIDITNWNPNDINWCTIAAGEVLKDGDVYYKVIYRNTLYAHELGMCLIKFKEKLIKELRLDFINIKIIPCNNALGEKYRKLVIVGAVLIDLESSQ